MVKIKYLCSCTKFLPFAELYFCRHCAKLKCKNCVLTEIDSYYCPHCLENVPSTEAKLKDNRCSNCYQCPICNSPLYCKNLRPKSIDNVNKEPVLPYLVCEVCLWNNKTHITPNQNTYMENSGLYDFNDIKLNELISYFQNMKSISYFNSTVRFPKSKYFMDTIQMKNLMGNNPNQIVNVANENYELDYEDKMKHLLPQLEQTNSINMFSTLDQKLCNLVQQPIMAVNLQPSNIHFSIRLVARCNECEHFIIKPELKPGNVHFKIDQMAMYYIPQLEIIYLPEYYDAKGVSEIDTLTKNNLIVVIKNMSAYPRNVAIQKFNLEGALKDVKENCESKTDFNQDIDALESSFNTNFMLDIPALEGGDGFALSKMPNDIESLACFQPLNLNLARCIKQGALPNDTVLYHQLNRVALKLGVRRTVEEDKGRNDKTMRCCYMTLSHNYSNPTLFSSSANTSLASSIKDKTLNAIGSLVGANVNGAESKDEKIPEITLRHVIRIEF